MVKLHVHIEGMGWLGSLVAHECHRAGFRFTWNDDHAPSAWAASTGQVYPAGDLRSMEDRATWQQWHEQPPWPWTGLTEEVEYWFTHKAPPHGGQYRVTEDVGWARRGDETAIQVDVQQIVRRTRSLFADQRRDRPEDADVTVVGHGFGRRLGSYIWGWSAPAQLVVPAEVREASRHRPSFVVMEHRFATGYAYPAPDSTAHWAGSAMIRQRRPTPRDADADAERWVTWIEGLTPLRVRWMGEARQGWRPGPQSDDPRADHVIGTAPGGLVQMPSLAANGVRWAPTALAELKDALGC